MSIKLGYSFLLATACASSALAEAPAGKEAKSNAPTAVKDDGPAVGAIVVPMDKLVSA